MEVEPCHRLAHAYEHPTRPCPCGAGVLPKWLWVVQTVGLGFCGCEMAGWEQICWRGEWIAAGAPKLRCVICLFSRFAVNMIDLWCE